MPRDKEPTKSRSIASVDLGDLKPQALAASAAAGLTLSTWLRQVVVRELGDASAQPAQKAPAKPLPEPSGAQVWLDEVNAAKLDELTERGAFRTRAAALRAVLDGINLSADDGGHSVADAVNALGISNHHLVTIGRKIDRICKSVDAEPGKTNISERLSLEESVQLIANHVELAARVISEVRPKLKSKREKQ